MLTNLNSSKCSYLKKNREETMTQLCLICLCLQIQLLFYDELFSNHADMILPVKQNKHILKMCTVYD